MCIRDSDTPVQFCANPAANAVLVYFAQQAKEQGITYLVKTEIPEKINIPETDISVLLGLSLIHIYPLGAKFSQ